jgi:para-aminobenzoate synthetase component I
MSLLIQTLPYPTNSTQLFERIRHAPWAILLDSGQPGSQYGRYDILVAQPFMTLCTKAEREGLTTEVTQNGISTTSSDDPFAILDAALAPYRMQQSIYPFCGGAVGYFGYDLARCVEHLETIAASTATPHMMVGVYDWAVVIDHREKAAQLVSHGTQTSTRENWDSLCALFTSDLTGDIREKCQTREFQTEELEAENFEAAKFEAPKFEVKAAITSNMDFNQYAQAFRQIKHYITEGDCYQVNLAQRFAAPAVGDSWIAYQKLREISPAPFMSYMNFGDMQVLSGSPERFLQVKNRHVETRPIKGTRPRATDIEQDKKHAEELQNSTKDRAENLMIVDLLRNDIGKNCETGSVKANTLFQLQSFANVHHLVSFVTGTLRQDKTAIELLRGCFPGGSITGAPKLRAMQIIEALEGHRRGVYCGAIGYIGFDGNMDTNIAIRTAVYAQGQISFYAGGGIVADSELEKEYAETLDKASSMLKTMTYFQGDSKGFNEKQQ